MEIITGDKRQLSPRERIYQHLVNYSDQDKNSALELASKAQPKVLVVEKVAVTTTGTYNYNFISANGDAKVGITNFDDAFKNLQILDGELFYATKITPYLAIRLTNLTDNIFARGRRYQYMSKEIYSKITNSGGSAEALSEAFYGGTLDFTIEKENILENIAMFNFQRVPRTQEKTVDILNNTPALTENYTEIDSLDFGTFEYMDLENYIVLTKRSNHKLTINLAPYSQKTAIQTTLTTNEKNQVFFGVALAGFSISGASNVITKFPTA